MRDLRWRGHLGCVLLQGVLPVREGSRWLPEDHQPRDRQDRPLLRAEEVRLQVEVTARAAVPAAARSGGIRSAAGRSSGLAARGAAGACPSHAARVRRTGPRRCAGKEREGPGGGLGVWGAKHEHHMNADPVNLWARGASLESSLVWLRDFSTTRSFKVDAFLHTSRLGVVGNLQS